MADGQLWPGDLARVWVEGDNAGHWMYPIYDSAELASMPRGAVAYVRSNCLVTVLSADSTREATYVLVNETLGWMLSSHLQKVTAC